MSSPQAGGRARRHAPARLHKEMSWKTENPARLRHGEDLCCNAFDVENSISLVAISAD